MMTSSSWLVLVLRALVMAVKAEAGEGGEGAALMAAVEAEEEEGEEEQAATRVLSGCGAYLACILKGTSWSCPSKL